MKLTVKQLKTILADMDDDAIVCARSRDCIGLCMVDVVNHPTMNEEKDGNKDISFVSSLQEVYGGDRYDRIDNKSGQAIIFCEND